MIVYSVCLISRNSQYHCDSILLITDMESLSPRERFDLGMFGIYKINDYLYYINIAHKNVAVFRNQPLIYNVIFDLIKPALREDKIDKLI